MKYDSTIFDIDGTLWNACATSAKGMNRALYERGVPKVLTTEDIENISGQPQDTAIKLLFGDLKLDADTLQAIDDGEQAAIQQEGGILYEGVLQGLQELSKHTRLFLVSNCQDWYLESFIRFAGINELLEGKNCYGLCHLSKGDMLSDIVKSHKASNAIYIGDTRGDWSAAESAGIDFIGAGYGFGDVSTAKHCFKSFSDIVQFLLR